MQHVAQQHNIEDNSSIVHNGGAAVEAPNTSAAAAGNYPTHDQAGLTAAPLNSRQATFEVSGTATYDSRAEQAVLGSFQEVSQPMQPSMLVPAEQAAGQKPSTHYSLEPFTANPGDVPVSLQPNAVMQPEETAAEQQPVLGVPQPSSRSLGFSRRRSRVGEAPGAANVQHASARTLCEQLPGGQTLSGNPPATAQRCAAHARLPHDAAVPRQPAGAVGSSTVPTHQQHTDRTVLSLHIHSSTQLLPDLLVTNPVVRLHVIDPATGQYLQTASHLSTTTAVQQQQYIPAMQTRPFDLMAAGLARAPAWDEQLTVDVPFQELVDRDALLLLEVLQLPSGFSYYKHHVQDFGVRGSGHPIAWAFLRLRGLSKQLMPDQPIQLQLQFYQYAPGSMMSSTPAGLRPHQAVWPVFTSWLHSGMATAPDGQAIPALSASSDGRPGSPSKSLGGWGRGSWSPSASADTTASRAAPAPTGRQSPLALTGRWVDKYPGFLKIALSFQQEAAPELALTGNARALTDVPGGGHSLWVTCLNFTIALSDCR
eukprot:GHRR01013737.1.p1 GENE.GHRR01013737.1~~GHRR01013737.1.p1  ORF type:complete len:538 (+),score=205.60 GHRR01013737.1:1766-3379(+)